MATSRKPKSLASVEQVFITTLFLSIALDSRITRLIKAAKRTPRTGVFGLADLLIKYGSQIMLLENVRNMIQEVLVHFTGTDTDSDLCVRLNKLRTAQEEYRTNAERIELLLAIRIAPDGFVGGEGVTIPPDSSTNNTQSRHRPRFRRSPPRTRPAFFYCLV